MAQARRLIYDPDVAHRRKHQWTNAYAEVVAQDGGHVGKCPNDLTQQEAQRLLEDGIPYHGRYSRKSRPERVYNIRDGVPYRAHIMGRVYHGFPEVPSEIPPEVMEELRNRAEDEGSTAQFEAWLERYRHL
jgi:hypothetical protein